MCAQFNRCRLRVPDRSASVRDASRTGRSRLGDGRVVLLLPRPAERPWLARGRPPSVPSPPRDVSGLRSRSPRLSFDVEITIFPKRFVVVAGEIRGEFVRYNRYGSPRTVCVGRWRRSENQTGPPKHTYGVRAEHHLRIARDKARGVITVLAAITSPNDKEPPAADDGVPEV